jgi:hypothetical protein
VASRFQHPDDITDFPKPLGYAIGKGHSVSVVWRGGEVDTIFGFEKEADALRWDQRESRRESRRDGC